jgi:hypothetical protein
VFITCREKDVGLVLDNTRAACVADHPQKRFQVLVINDKKDSELENDRRFQPRIPKSVLPCRIKVKSVPHHFKAGNLTQVERTSWQSWRAVRESSLLPWIWI